MNFCIVHNRISPRFLSTSLRLQINRFQSQQYLFESQPFSSSAPQPNSIKVSIELIKNLRSITCAPITDCKNALQSILTGNLAIKISNDELIQKSIEWLRKKGIQTANRKNGKQTSNGLIGLHRFQNVAVLCELNSETEFVAKNYHFQSLLANITRTVINQMKFLSSSQQLDFQSELSVENVHQLSCDNNLTLIENITTAVGVLGEQLKLRRIKQIQVKNGVIGHYVHSRVFDNEEINNQNSSGNIIEMGRIGALVAVELPSEIEITNELRSELDLIAHIIAMQIVAANSQYIHSSDIPEEILSNERQIIIEQINEMKRNGEVKNEEKLIEGRLKKWIEEVSFDEQKLQILAEGEKPERMSKWLKKKAQQLRVSSLNVTQFIRFEVGEGIKLESKQSFADEVAAKVEKAEEKQKLRLNQSQSKQAIA